MAVPPPPPEPPVPPPPPHPDGWKQNSDGTAWQDALTQARFLVSLDADYLVVDTETGWPRFARAVELARALGASCLPLNEVLGRPRIDHWRQAV